MTLTPQAAVLPDSRPRCVGMLLTSSSSRGLAIDGNDWSQSSFLVDVVLAFEGSLRTRDYDYMGPQGSMLMIIGFTHIHIYIYTYRGFP